MCQSDGVHRTEESACPSTARSTPAAPWVEVVATDADWDAADPAAAAHDATPSWSGSATFEEYVLELAGAGLIHGPAHSSIGQEGGAVGSVLALTSEDSVNGSHRGHHQFLAKALHHVEPKGIDPLAPPSDDVRDVLLRTLAEICGLDRGWSHGRGGSMHLQWKEAGAMGTNAIVGGGVPQAAGFAWSPTSSAGTDAVSVTYFGDGAVNIGSTLETLNLAAAWSLPVCFFIENNQYAVSTSRRRGDRRAAAVRPAAPASASRSWKVDGMDPLAVHLAMTEAVEHMRPATARRSSRPTPTASSTRTAASPAARSATATRRRRRPWRGATRSTRPPPTSSGAAS